MKYVKNSLRRREYTNDGGSCRLGLNHSEHNENLLYNLWNKRFTFFTTPSP